MNSSKDEDAPLLLQLDPKSLNGTMQYGSVDYWDDRYGNDKEPFEWYQNYGGIRHFLTPRYLCRQSNKGGDDDIEAAVPGDITLQRPGAEATEENRDDKVGDEKPGDSATERPRNSIEAPGNNCADEDANNPFHSTTDCRVLITGCGNSRVGEAMLSDGFRRITNVDFSSIVINQLKDRYTDEWHEKLYARIRRKLGGQEDAKSPGGKRKAQVTARSKPRVPTTTRPSIPKKKTSRKSSAVAEKMMFECIDLTKNSKYADSSFDLIFCKGTLDAVLCGAKAAERVREFMNECHRVLDDKYGVMVIITYGDPESRLGCFDDNQWDIKTYNVPKPLVPGEKVGEEHYVYILFKKQIS